MIKIKTSSLKLKEVININNGQRLGSIIDIDVDLEAGRIKGFVVPKEEGGFKIFSKKEDQYIGWNQIKRIGQDVILVDIDGASENIFSDEYE